MSRPGESIETDILIAGGGVAALEATLTVRELAGADPRIVLLAPNRTFRYTPLSVGEPFGLGYAHTFDLQELLRPTGAAAIHDHLEAVDGEGRSARARGGAELRFRALLLAIGAPKRSALPGAVTFTGSRSRDDLRRVLAAARAGELERIAFAVPAGVAWSLPAYELALMSAAHLEENGSRTGVAIVTPEARPLDAFGAGASEIVAELLAERRVDFHTAIPERVDPGRLVLAAGEAIRADAVVALPRLTAPSIAGVPGGKDGFIDIDERCRVRGLPGVYAAGDATSFPLKQGGIAAQQADVAAAAIASELGFGVEVPHFRPRLRGLLLAGPMPRYLRAELLAGPGREGVTRAGSWPPAKIAGRRLGPFLALHGAAGGPSPDALALQLESPIVPTPPDGG